MATGEPITRGILDQLDGWVSALAAPLGSPKRVVESDGQFHWEFSVQSAEVVQVGKLVRMVSGIRVAMLLADRGFTAECGTILRTVSDFSQEVTALGEGLFESRMTPGQQQFIDQYFSPLPSDADEFAARERERYVGREELLKAHRRMLEQTPVSADELLKLTRFVNKGYDTYVHGGYLTAMELYHGHDGEFMLNGHRGERVRCTYRAAVAAKLHEVLIAIRFMAMTRGLEQVNVDAREALLRLQTSGEISNKRCLEISGRQSAV